MPEKLFLWKQVRWETSASVLWAGEKEKKMKPSGGSYCSLSLVVVVGGVTFYLWENETA